MSSSIPSDTFIDHLTDLVWEDCRGKDIHINQPILIERSTNETVSLISGGYSKEDLRYVLKLLGSVPYDFFVGTCEEKSQNNDIGWDGCGIITCEGNKLDINSDVYYWNGVKVDVPRDEFKIASGNNSQIIETGDNSLVTTGDKSPITTGDDSPISQKDWNIGFVQGSILGTILGIILKFMYDYAIKKIIKK